MTTYDEALAIGVCIGSAFTGMVATLLWFKRTALPVNPDWPEPPVSDHFISACAACHVVTRLRPSQRALTVHLGDTLKVSHGLCPICERKAHAEIDALLPAVKPA